MSYNFLMHMLPAADERKCKKEPHDTCCKHGGARFHKTGR